MKTILITLVLIFCLSAGISYGYEQKLEFTWSYFSPIDLAGFKIYQDDIMIADIPDPDTRVLLGTFEVTGASQAYTITAYDQGGQESPKSGPYSVDPPPGGVTGFTVSIK